MSALRRLRERVAPSQAVHNGSPNGGGPSGAASGSAQRRSVVSSTELARRQTAAAKRFAEAQWDLGGLAYEMAIRDHFRLDVLQRAAAQVQELDAELSNLSRLLELERDGAAGACPGCGALHGRGAAFCSSCGTALVESVRAG